MGINAIVECGLISLHRKTVIGLQIDNRRSNFRLTSHGVNRNQSKDCSDFLSPDVNLTVGNAKAVSVALRCAAAF
jgi:hypothetical protein